MSTTEDILKQLQAEINALREQNTTLQALLAKHEKYSVKCPACGGSTHAARYGYSCKQQFGLCGILGHQGPAASFAKTSSKGGYATQYTVESYNEFDADGVFIFIAGKVASPEEYFGLAKANLSDGEVTEKGED